MSSSFKQIYLKPRNFLVPLFVVLYLGTVSGIGESDAFNGDFNRTSDFRNGSLADIGIGYQNGTPDDSLKAFWRFDDNTSGLIDYSGNGNDGTINGPVLAEGIFSTSSYSFASGDYVEVPNSQSLNPQSLTISAWINPSDVSSDHPIVQKTTSTDQGYTLFINNYFGVPRLTLRLQSTADNDQEVRSETGLPANEWTHVAATYNDSNGKARLYINGENQSISSRGTARDQPPYSYDLDGSELVLGSSSASSGGDLFVGDMDEIRIFNRSLGPDQIKDLAIVGSSGVYQGSYSKFFDLTDFERAENVTVSGSNLGSDATNASLSVSTSGTRETRSLSNGLINYSFTPSFEGDLDIGFEFNSSDVTQTPFIGNYTVFTEEKPFFVAIEEPENKIFPTEDIPLKVFSNRVPDNWFYSLDQNTNESFTPNTTINGVSDGSHDLKVWANSSGEFANSSTNFTVDTTPPVTKNFVDDTGGSISQIESADISIEAKDDISGVREVKLATNETGIFENKTGIYGSPVEFNSPTGTFWKANFNWRNISFSGELGYRLYYRDEVGNSDKTPVESFTVESTNLSSIFELKNASDWNKGIFNFTTPESVETSGDTGNLRLGYLNGSSADSINAFWRFDSPLSGIYKDYSGRDNSGSISGVQQVEGIFSTDAAGFTASNEEYVEVSHSSELSPDNFTISAWVNPSFTGSDMPIVEKTSGGEGYQFRIENHFGENRLGLLLESSVDGTQRYRTDQSLQENKWQLVTVRYNSSGVEFYIDAQRAPKFDSASTFSRNTGTQDILLGATSASSGGEYYNGKLDELKIYDKALSKSEINELYLNSTGTFNGSYKYDYTLNDQEIPDVLQVSAENLADNTASVKIQTQEKKERLKLDGSEIYSNLGFQQDEGELNLTLDLGSSSPSDSPIINSLNILTSDLKSNIISNSSVNNSEPVEGEEVKASYNFTNNGSRKVLNATVEYSLETYNGTQWINLNQKTDFIELKKGESKIKNLSFNAVPGPYRLNSSADIGDRVAESVETDNNDSTIFNVDSYQVFHGGSVERVELSNTNEFSIQSWLSDQVDGTLYFTDSDTSFSTSDLLPLNRTGNLASADDALNLTGHNDSLENLFDPNGDGNADSKGCILVSGSELCDVPLINSTNTSNFKTGILYSTSAGQPYDGSQNLVFTTEINSSRTGKYGTYDYEIRVPYSLGTQRPDQDKISVYQEIQ